MTGRMYEVTLRRTFNAPRLTLWGLIADTNRWDRASGLTAGSYSWDTHDGRRVRIGRARELGFDIVWVEPPYQWIEGHMVDGSRTFLQGPVAQGGFKAHVHDAGNDTCEVIATAYVSGQGALMPVLGRVMKRRFATALRTYLDGLGDVLATAAVTAQRAEPGERISATWVARELIAERSYDTLTQGPRSPTSNAELLRRAARLRGPSLPADLVQRLTQILAERPDEEVAQLRPFELAARWNVDRRQLLRVFLHATRAGLVDLRWQINCPVCRVAAQVVGSLADVSGNVHCAACNIDYGIDFGRHVEAVFQCHPAIRTVDTRVYCASSPAFQPHVFAQLTLAPGALRNEPMVLPEGRYHLRVLATPQRAELEVPAQRTLSITLEPTHIAAHVSAEVEASPTLRMQSHLDVASTLLIERSADDGLAVLGSVIASFPDFLDLFATEAPATGVELSIAHLALLFSDLTGSTALYQQVGDARAFAIVQEHFVDMAHVVSAHNGAIVKTMGDAVMASFVSDQDAVRAAIAMIKRCHEHHGALGLGAKLGVHAGPVLAVRANDRLDYFGTTVNLAARLQAQAEGGQVVVTQAHAEQAEIRALLSGLPSTPFQAQLKGIASAQSLVAIDVA